MEVGGDDLRPLKIAQHVARYELPVLVVAVRIVGLEHPEPVLDGDAGSDDQEAPREAPAARTAHRVDRLPGDEHGHDGGLAGAGCELQGQPGERRIGFLIRRVQLFAELASGGELGRDFGQPDDRLHRLDLTEEGADIVESVVTPVMQQPGRLWRDPPLTEVGQRPPAVDGVTDAVDGLRQLVLLAFSRGPLCLLVEAQRLLILTAFDLLRLGDRRDERNLSPPLPDVVGRLAFSVKLPMPRGVLVG